MGVDPVQLIGVDWGTTNLRVMKIGDEGKLIDQRSDPRGAKGLAPGDFADTLRDVAADWLAPSRQVLVCGMAGARGAWREAAYSPCPAGLASIAGSLYPAEGVDRTWIVPGVSYAPDSRLIDVMRGEETQALGLFGPNANGLMVAPGTHSKWCRIHSGEVQTVTTYMTGELFEAVRGGTLLGTGMGHPGIDDLAFDEGVICGLTNPTLSAALFSLRVASLADRLAETGRADYLSGVLIGAEIGGGLVEALAADQITVVADARIAARYVRAFALADVANVNLVNAETATARGLWRIWKERSWA